MLDRIERLLEDQPPLVRSNMRLGVLMLGAVLILQVGIGVGLRTVERAMLFKLEVGLQLLRTLLLLMLVMMCYNALKIIWNYMRGRGVFTVVSTTLAVFSILLIALSIRGFPDLFKRAVAYETGRSYGAVYDDFSALCTRWETEWQGSVAITMDLATEDLGGLQGVGEAYRVSSTVFFNFGDADEPEFGFACLLKESTPPTFGRASDYLYEPIQGIEQRFMEKKE